MEKNHSKVECREVPEFVIQHARRRRRRPSRVEQFPPTAEAVVAMKNKKAPLQSLPVKKVNKAKDTSAELPYKDDLDFLNKLSPDKVAGLSSTFKNEGRGNVRENKTKAWYGKWEPVMGTYHPVYDTVLKNSVKDKYMAIKKEPELAIGERINKIEMRKTTICPKFLDNEINHSPLVIFKKR